MPAKGLIPDKINILDIKIIKGEIESPFEFDISKVSGHEFNVDLQPSFNVEKKIVKADFKISIETVTDEEYAPKASGYFHFVFMFHIENMEDLVEFEKDGSSEISIRAALGNALASITYSTVRGILITRFQGTSLASFILPVTDPNDLLK